MLLTGSVTTATERLPLLPDVERVFADFVRNSNSVADHAKTVRGSAYRDQGSRPRVVLEKLVPISEPPPPVADPLVTVDEALIQTRDTRTTGRPPREEASESAEAARGPITEQLEAMAVVPDVRSVIPPPPPVREKGEDGQVPTRELERIMNDMAVLLRYGHDQEVGERLDDLQVRYPRDLLLLRRIAEFHLETRSKDLAAECLFKLASSLFERRNFRGMRAALQQVLILRPNDPRAIKLLGLLDNR